MYDEYLQAANQLQLPGYAEMAAADQRVFKSDTGQLTLDYGQGLFTIDAPRTQAAIGFLQKAGEIQLGSLQIQASVPYAAIVATSLDRQPLGESRRLLVTSVGRAENTAQGFWPPTQQQLRWSPVQWMLPGEGRLPVITEPVHAEVTVRVPGSATIYALDSSGERQQTLAAEQQGQLVRFNPAAARSIWCEVVVGGSNSAELP